MTLTDKYVAALGEIAELKRKIQDKDKELMQIRGDHMGTCNELLRLKVDTLIKKIKGGGEDE